MFTYTSVESHGILTPDGEKVKETVVNVEDGRGTKTVIMKDEQGIHSDTMPLKTSEMKNIEKRQFMPNLFRSSMKNISAKKVKSHKRKSHKGKSGSKKSQKPWFGLFQ